MNWKKIAAFALALSLAVPIGAGCTKAAAAPMTLTYNLSTEPASLDSAVVTGVPEMTVLDALFEGLTRLDDKCLPEAAAAENWDISGDGLTYTFHLRKGMKWSNGDPVTAEDFKYAWLRVLDPNTAAEYAYQLYYIQGGEAYNSGKVTADAVGLEAVDARTLKVTLAAPTPYFLSLMAFQTYGPVHKATVEQFGDAYGAEAANIVTNGPFTLDKWEHRSVLEMKKFKDYWDRKNVKLDMLRFFTVEEASTELAMFETGECDVIDNPPLEEIDQLKAEGKLMIAPQVGVYYYLFNTTKKPFDDVRVRKAFALAVNRQDIVTLVTKGGQLPAMAIVPASIPNPVTGKSFREEGGDFFKDADIATAQQLLADAGYPGGKGIPAIEILYNTSEGHKKIAEAIMEMWKQNLGVTNITTRNEEWAVYLDTRDQGNFQVARAGWIGDYLDPMTFLDMWTTGNGNNNTFWGEPAYDELVAVTKTASDQKTRFDNMHQLEGMFMEDMPMFPIYYYTDLYLIKPYVKGAVKTPIGPSFEFKRAYIEGKPEGQ